MRRWFRLPVLPVLLVLLGAGLAGPLLPAAGPAEAGQPAALVAGQPAAAGQPATPAPVACAATGYLVRSEAELAELHEALAGQGVHRADGVPLDRVSTWAVPDGSRPVVVLDTAAPVLSGGQVSVSLAGQSYVVSTQTFAQAQDRYIASVALPHLGPTVRSLGLTVTSDPCRVAVAVAVDRAGWSTLAGLAGAGLAVLGGLGLVLVARLRTGGWLRRSATAAPLGLLAGLGLVVVLLEAGAVGPFDPLPWWPPVAGLVVAAVLPLTRWRRRVGAGASSPVPPGSWPAGSWPVPEHAPLGGYRLDQVVAGTELAVIYRATRVRVAADPGGWESGGSEPDGSGAAAAGPDRALVKVVSADRFGDPAARLRIEREAAVLAGLAHPNLLRLRAVVPAAGGPPTLVFEDVAGAPLRALFLAGGTLSGAQAVNVVLAVLSGLAELHARELVHRDVRPENVWLTIDGRVLLAGCEVAVPGVEHAVAPEGAPPYASPEQAAGRVLDRRSDLWGCGILLAELLTGQARPDPAGLPDPLARVLARALAEDPADRPDGARELADQLREAAGQAFGEDWPGRGALAGAVVAHGAVGAAAGGYALAGAVAGAVAGAGTGTGVLAGGLGAAGAAAGGGALGLAGSAPAVAGAGSAVAGTAGASPAGALVNAAVAILAGVAITVGVAVVDSRPAQAEPVRVTPEQARVIFLRTMAEGWVADFDHFTEPAQDVFDQLREDREPASGELAPTGIQVGVPRAQPDYPLYFVASALVEFEDETASVFAWFDREAADHPWLMRTFRWSSDRLLPGPQLDPDGWLAPAPAITDLLVDPGQLPQRYHDWLVESNQAGRIRDEELLRLRFDDTGMVFWFTEDVPFFQGTDADPFSYEYEMSLGEVVTDLVPLVDGTVQVIFTSVIRQTTYNTPDQRAVSCDQFSLSWTNDDPPGDFRWLAQDLVVGVEAWIPIVAAALPQRAPGAAPSLAPSPAPTGEPSEEEERSEEERSEEERSEEERSEEEEEPEPLELEPVDPTVVLIEDWNYQTGNRDGERC